MRDASEIAGHTERRELLARLARQFEEPDDALLDWDALREAKGQAWPLR